MHILSAGPMCSLRRALLFWLVPLFLALIVGTYSSVYLAAPLLIWLGVDSNSFVPEETALDQQEAAARKLT